MDERRTISRRRFRPPVLVLLRRRPDPGVPTDLLRNAADQPRIIRPDSWALAHIQKDRWSEEDRRRSTDQPSHFYRVEVAVVDWRFLVQCITHRNVFRSQKATPVVRPHLGCFSDMLVLLPVCRVQGLPQREEISCGCNGGTRLGRSRSCDKRTCLQPHPRCGEISNSRSSQRRPSVQGRFFFSSSGQEPACSAEQTTFVLPAAKRVGYGQGIHSA